MFSFHKEEALRFFLKSVLQNHRIVKAGRHLWRLSSPTPMLRQNQIELATQDCVQSVLKNSKNGDIANSLGNMFHCSTTLTVKVFFLCLNWISLISVYAHCFSSLNHHEASDSRTTISRSISLLFMYQMLQSLHPVRGPLVDSLQHVHCLLCTEEPRNGPSTTDVFHQGRAEGKDLAKHQKKKSTV